MTNSYVVDENIQLSHLCKNMIFIEINLNSMFIIYQLYGDRIAEYPSLKHNKF